MKLIARIYIYDSRLRNISPFIMQLAHFRNMLIILLHRLKTYLGYYPTKEALLYSLLANKLRLSKTKDEKKIEKLNELLTIIKSDKFLSELLNNMKKVKNEIKNVPAIQSIIRHVCRNFKSYRKSYKEYLKNPNRFTGKPKPPKPKKLKNIDKFTLELNKNSFKVKNRTLIIKLYKNKKIRIKLPNFIKEPSSVRITYYLGFSYVDVVYTKYIEELKPLGNYKAGIDLGVENILTIASTNNNIPSLIIKSSHLKAYNQWYNKLLSKLRSRIDTINNLLNKEDTKNREELREELAILIRRLEKLHPHRKKWMESIAHKVTKAIAVYLHKKGHDKVFVGKNILEAKNGCKLCKKVNQMFVQIPFRLFIDKLKYKLKWFGITLIEVDESYTSKASCISDDIIEIQKMFRNKEKVSMSGDRITRSLFKDLKLNKVFHADVNGAFNILKVGLKKKKLFEDVKTIMVKLCNPIKYNLYKFCNLILSKATPEPSLVGW